MATEDAIARRKLLLNLISDVKARLTGKVDLAFPIPQFIVVGKQSVGKSRLIEGLVGEPFNFVSGTLGSRRPTVLEMRNVPGLSPNKWSVFDEASKQWQQQPVSKVMQLVGAAHESLGNDVTEVPIRVKVEGDETVDLGLVDLPGFRSYAKDAKMQVLVTKIDKLVNKFMADENNVMLCVEEAGDAAGYVTLGRCKQVDPSYRRTILVRNKLDKYYNDLTVENINKWLEGFGDLPDNLERFAVSLPHWSGQAPPSPFGKMRDECAQKDQRTMQAKGMSQKYNDTIGFNKFRLFMEVKTQHLFSASLGPLLAKMKEAKQTKDDYRTAVEKELSMVDEDSILHATRQAGITFAQSFNFMMGGAISSQTNRKTLEEELVQFKEYALAQGKLAEEDMNCAEFTSIEEYVEYLRDVVELPGMDLELNGGAQFKRLMYEVEIFTRFAGLGATVSEQDVIRARGSGMRESSWRNTISMLMTKEAPLRMIPKTTYVGERLKWFFIEQKECTLQFMLEVQGSAEEHMYSSQVYKQGQILARNETMKECIFNTFDSTCSRHKEAFMTMWQDWMQAMFASPMQLLKAGSMPKLDESYEGEVAPTLDTTKERIATERFNRVGVQNKIGEQIKNIPDDDSQARESAMMVQSIIEQVFHIIRCNVADQMELYSKSFFLVPMLRRLEGDMAMLELEDSEKEKYQMRKTTLDAEKETSTKIVTDLDWCIDAVQKFRITSGGGE